MQDKDSREKNANVFLKSKVFSKNPYLALTYKNTLANTKIFEILILHLQKKNTGYKHTQFVTMSNDYRQTNVQRDMLLQTCLTNV